MKKKIVAALTCAAVLMVGVGAALAAPGTGEDPFVTRSYLNDVYCAEAEQAMLEQAQAATQATGQAALDRLSALADGYLAQAGGGDSAADWRYADAVLHLSLSRGDKLEIPTGASFLLEAGRGTLTVASGALVDVTSGSTVGSGGTLTAGHRYLAAEGAVCAFTAVTDAAALSVQGYYDLERTGQTQTPFTDLASTDWYYSYVRFVYENGLFEGTGTTGSGSVFSAGTNMSRAMLAVVLQRLAGETGTAPSAGFSDVSAGTWYTDAVNWAANAGVVTGDGGKFSPAADVSREQMAVMLYRYAKDYAGRNVTAAGDLSAFPDRAKVSGWAEDALAWAVGAGIIGGDGDGNLSPGSSASRAVVATMLQRFCAYLDSTDPAR